MDILTREPLEGAALPLAVADARPAGAEVSFAGIVRADVLDGRVVTALVYEAYEPMAEREVARLVAEARTRWTILGVGIRHRLGEVPAGEAAVRVTVTAAHRGEAFAAAQFIMHGIKHSVPIWKRERYHDGSGTWVVCSHAQEGAHALV